VCLQIDKNVEREILNHRMLNNINVIAFKEVGVEQQSIPHTSTQRQQTVRLSQLAV
jgi:hypothetical protein